MLQPTFSRSQVLVRTWPFLLDVIIATAGLACFYAVLMVAHNWIGVAQPDADDPSCAAARCPLYAIFSVVRMFRRLLHQPGFALSAMATSPRTIRALKLS
jgi:NitT/TauT family transport system permease protein